MPKEVCSYFSHPLDVYEASPGQSPRTSRYCCGNLSGKLQQAFLKSLKRKGLKVTFRQHDFQMQCSGAPFCIFLWRNDQLLSKFYDLLLFSPCLRSNSYHCQAMNFFLSGFPFTTIHESQDFKGRGRAFLYLLTSTSTRFTYT